jgi:hypothetical protein
MRGSDLYESDGGLFAWTSIGQKTTGLNGCIWAAVGGICAVESPIVVYTNTHNPDGFDKCLIISLETMDILCNNGKYTEEFIRIIKWIEINQHILLKHWNFETGYGSSKQIIDKVVKI